MKDNYTSKHSYIKVEEETGGMDILNQVPYDAYRNKWEVTLIAPHKFTIFYDAWV